MLHHPTSMSTCPMNASAVILSTLLVRLGAHKSRRPQRSYVHHARCATQCTFTMLLLKDFTIPTASAALDPYLDDIG